MTMRRDPMWSDEERELAAQLAVEGDDGAFGAGRVFADVEHSARTVGERTVFFAQGDEFLEELVPVLAGVEAAVEEVVERPPEVQQVQYHHAEPGAEEGGETAVKARPQTNALPKVGRNDPCPCGSGKKYKHCHGKLS